MLRHITSCNLSTCNKSSISGLLAIGISAARRSLKQTSSSFLLFLRKKSLNSDYESHCTRLLFNYLRDKTITVYVCKLNFFRCYVTVEYASNFVNTLVSRSSRFSSVRDLYFLHLSLYVSSLGTRTAFCRRPESSINPIVPCFARESNDGFRGIER